MRCKTDILEIFRRHGALKEGHFVLASGLHSANYFQVACLTQHPAVLDELIRDRLAGNELSGRVDTVLSPAVGAIAVGQQLGLAIRCRAIFAERDSENKMTLKRGFALGAGEKILLVEDVITTGGTLDELKRLTDDVRAEIAGVFSVVNRSGKDNWRGISILSVLDHAFPVFSKEDCPMCREGSPAVRPGTKIVQMEESRREK